MIEELKLSVSPREAASLDSLRKIAAMQKNMEESGINDLKIVRRSIDARQKIIKMNLDLLIATGADSKIIPRFSPIEFRKLPEDAPRLVIVGAGPAGLFAALKAIELGIRPIVVERGAPVEERRKILADISRKGVVDPDTNYCFGEGGAGAYSDGKLFTRSKKRGDVTEILNLLRQFGADEDILIDAHAHIGSDKLPSIIRNIRNEIINCGGEVRFNEKMTDLIISDNEVKGIVTSKGNRIEGNVVLASGHSAKDVYRLLDKKGICIEPKGFAMGVRLEHPQALIDSLQYHTKKERDKFLPPAEYRLLTRVDGRAVYSFCMCPGGVVVPSMSAPGESLVNGMSASARSGQYANAAIVVEILPEDIKDEGSGELRLLDLQEKLEKDFFRAAENSASAPAQRMKDFVEGKASEDLPGTSYPAGLINTRVDRILPAFISKKIKEGFKAFDKKKPGFMSNEALVLGLESRTSSPVRIPRDKETFQHPQIKGLYPAGEGAGYAGGIVSSAIDGQRCVIAFAENLKKKVADG